MIRDRLARPAIVLWQAALFGVVFLVVPACQPAGPGRPSATDGTGADRYVPVYSAPAGARESRGTVRGDFQWAADAATLEEAVLRWQRYLETHNPPGREFEDGFHASYVNAAQYELLRVYYLLGRREDGDALLRRLDPVGWER